MKNVSNFQTFLIFFLVLVVLFWVMPNNKIDTIGDFFKKIVTPAAIPLSIGLGIKKYGKIMKGKKGKSP